MARPQPLPFGSGSDGAPPEDAPLVAVASPREDWFEEWALNALVVLFYLPVALGSLLYLAYTGGEYALEVRVLGENVGRDIAAGVATGTGVVILSRLLVPRFAMGRKMAFALRRVMGSPTLLGCLTIALFSALGEELLFRAVLQERLGIGIATALFAIAHFPMEKDLWLWPVVALPAGLLFGGLYDWSGAVLAPVIAHAVINALNLRWLSQLPSEG